MKTSHSPPPPAHKLPVGILIGAVAVLYFAKEVLIPLALALLLSFLLAPVVRRVERLGLSRAPATLAVVVLFLCAVGGIGWLMAHQVIDLAAKAPSYQSNIERKMQSLQSKGGTFKTAAKVIGNIQKQSQEASPEPTPPPKDKEERVANTITNATLPDQAPVEVRIVDAPPTPPQFLRNMLGTLLAPLGMAGIVVLFTIFMLIQREDLRDRLLHLAGPERLTVTTQAVDDAGNRVSRYLTMQALVNTCFGVAIGAGLFFIHVPNAVLWGLLAGIFRFVPYVGPMIGATCPTLLALAAFPTWQPVFLTLGLFLVIELIVSNAIEPWLYGANTGISPVAVLVAATFWTWLWGGVGLLLSTPLTVCIVVLGRYVPRLEFLHTLLGDQPVVPPDARLYQRLLAFDQEESAELVEEYLKDHSTAEFYDQVLIPALNQAQIDVQLGNLDGERQQFVRQTASAVIEDLRDRPPATDGKDDAPALPPAGTLAVTALILPVKSDMDELAGEAFAHQLSLEGIGAEVLPSKSLANEMLEAVAARNVQVICLSALRPFAVMQARYLIKRMRAQFPQLKIVVGLWDSKKPSIGTKRNLQSTPADCVANTFAEALQSIREMHQYGQPETAPAASPVGPLPIPGETQPLVDKAG